MIKKLQSKLSFSWKNLILHRTNLKPGMPTNGSSTSTMAGRSSIAGPGSSTGTLLYKENLLIITIGSGIRDKNKIIGESTIKSDPPKVGGITSKGSPTQDLSDKTKDYVKVPTIKKKV